MNLTFISPPISFVQLSYLIYCSLCLCVAFLSFYFPLFNPIHYPGPFCPSLSGHTKHSTQYGWGFLHILSSSPLGCRIHERIPGGCFFFLCTGGMTNTQRGKPVEVPSWRINAFERHSHQRQKFFGGLIVLPYAWSLWNSEVERRTLLFFYFFFDPVKECGLITQYLFLTEYET